MDKVSEAKALIETLRRTQALIEKASHLANTYGYREYATIINTLNELREITEKNGAKNIYLNKPSTSISMEAIRFFITDIHRQFEDYTLEMFAYLGHCDDEHASPMPDFNERINATLKRLMIAIAVPLNTILEAPGRMTAATIR